MLEHQAKFFKWKRKSTLNIHWKDWFWSWSWSSNTLVTKWEELTNWKRPWCWARLKAEGEGNNRGWDGWMASPTRWTWVCASSRRWWRTGRPGVLQSMGSQRAGHDWVTELNKLNQISILVLQGKIPLEPPKPSRIYYWRGPDLWGLICLLCLHLLPTPSQPPATGRFTLKHPELGWSAACWRWWR